MEKIDKPYDYNTGRLRKDKQMLKAHLRRFFTFSRLKYSVLRKAAFKDGRKTRYQCASCKLFFNEKSVEIDHIKEIAPKQNHDDLQSYATELIKHFFELSNLRVLCRQCHARKGQYDL